MSDLSSTIETVASGPAQVTTDNTSVVAQKLPDLIEADRYLSARSSAKKRARGLRFTKLISPGPVGTSTLNGQV